jgi:hypothetical protein
MGFDNMQHCEMEIQLRREPLAFDLLAIIRHLYTNEMLSTISRRISKVIVGL